MTALVNGHHSLRVPITSGVRQGWPLAVGQGLLAWLKSRGVSLPLGPRHITASQYADNCAPFLDGPGALHPFMAAMDVFRLASGQRLNLDKFELLPLGAAAAAAGGSGGPLAAPPPQQAAGFGPLAGAVGPPPSPPPASGPAAASLLSSIWRLPAAALARLVALVRPPPAASPGSPPPPTPPPPPPPQLRTVDQAKALAVCFRNDAAALPVDLAGVYAALARAARRPLSTFGRAAAASGYAVSKVLYHLEFQGLSPRAEVDRLPGSVSAVVDRAMTPAHQAAAPNARLPGLSARLVPLPPALGGFGLLPFLPHVRARQAVAAVRFVQRAAGLLLPRPGVFLRRCHSAAHPLCLLAPYTGRVLRVAPPADCPAFNRLLGALSVLGPPVLLDPGPMGGPWCFAAPLWGNPDWWRSTGAALRPTSRCSSGCGASLLSVRPSAAGPHCQGGHVASARPTPAGARRTARCLHC